MGVFAGLITANVYLLSASPDSCSQMEHFPVPGRLRMHLWCPFCVALFVSLGLVDPDVKTLSFQVATWHFKVTESSYRKECS